MGKTSIEWTEFSINPIRARLPEEAGGEATDPHHRAGHYCEKTSSGCANCYASLLQKRFGMPAFGGKHPPQEPVVKENGAVDVPGGIEVFLDRSKLHEVLRRRKPTTWFWCDMTDMYGWWVPDAWLDLITAVQVLTPHHTHQVLTKRVDRMADHTEQIAEEPHRIGVAMGDLLDGDWIHGPGKRFRKEIEQQINVWHGFEPDEEAFGLQTVEPVWPPPNIWRGVSVENQREADARREDFRRCLAAVRFVSYEPAVGPVNWSGSAGWEFVDWIISGGESGPQARVHHPQWHRDTRDWCVARGIAYLFKQWGAWAPGISDDRVCVFPDGSTDQTKRAGGQWMRRGTKKGNGRELDGRTWDQMPQVGSVVRIQGSGEERKESRS